jgi:outer membrane autotransporter protein
MASVAASVCLFYSTAVSAQSAPPPPPAPPGPVAPAPTLDWERSAVVRDLQARSNGTASRATRESVRFQLSPFGRRYGAPVDRAFDAWASFDPEAKSGEPDRLWHAWASPHLGWTRRDHPVIGYDGTQGGGAIGVDRRIGDRSVLGVFVHHETANFTMKPVNGSLHSHLDGIGAYGGIALGETVVIDAMILWQSGKTRLRDAGATGTYDNQRWSFAANVTGYHSLGSVQVAPSVGFDVSLDRQDAFTDSLGFAYAARRIDTVALTAGLEIGREFAMANGGNVTPFIGAGARYDVMRRDTGAVGATYDPSRLDLSVRLGLRAEPTSAVSLSLEMDVSGLARRNQATMGANARLGVRF